jgi:tetratricopeptide (TPR) repeat protein
MLALDGDAPEDAKVMVRILDVAGGTGEPAVEQMNDLLQAWGVNPNESRYPLLALIEPAVHALMNNSDGAKISFQRALRHADPWARAVARLGGALAAENAGELDRAERWFYLGVRAFRRLGDRWGLSMSLSGLSGIRSIRGDIPAAIEGFEEAIRLEVELGPLPAPPLMACRLAQQRYRAGDVEGATRALERALVLSQDQGQHAVTTVIRCQLSTQARVQGDFAGARAHLTAARALLAARPDATGDPTSAWVDTEEMALLVAEGKPAQARGLGGSALVVTQRGYMTDSQSIAAVGEKLAEVAAAENDLTSAARLLGASAAVRGAMDMGSPEIRALLARFGPAEQEVLAQAKELAMDQALEVLRQGASAPPVAEAP